MRSKLPRTFAVMQLVLVVGFGACGPAKAGSQPAPVQVGVQVLLRDSLGLVRGKRVGLITNQTGVFRAADGRIVSDIDTLYHHPDVDLVALFSPEHGIRGTARGGASIAGATDSATGLPIHSLYGATRVPTPEMLAAIDVLLFDIQDIGTRYYTYVWTMAHAMEAAARDSIPFVVLDRPDPIGGTLVQGNVQDTAHLSFVGLYLVPMRHGMTAGELAGLLNDAYGIGARLDVVPMQGWKRSEWYDDTGLAWVAPSPNMPSLESATHYPGTCLFEGTNLSVGRGTDRAFQQIGAPWLDNQAIKADMNALGLPGVRFEAVEFTPAHPGDDKYDGQPVRGIRLITTDRSAYDPTTAAVALLVDIQRRQGDRLAWRASHFDRLAGNGRLRTMVQAGATVAAITAPWAGQLAAFRKLRQQYLLYP
ncbi:MAG TPA: DUF1343 domain-containing protein [Longimicrobiales bacterium]|nr:DUF1343 domain-containing protein [Longimicrobiales bacterium]